METVQAQQGMVKGAAAGSKSGLIFPFEGSPSRVAVARIAAVDDLMVCSGCGVELNTPVVCVYCKAAAYCSKDCQGKDWKAGHRLACKRLAEDAAEDVLRHPSAGQDVASAQMGSALCEASQNGQMDMVDQLLGKGACADAATKEDGWTALLHASGSGHTEVVEKLLARGASIDVQAKDGVTALMMASLEGHGEVVEKLLEKGASVNMQESQGFTALMLASQLGHGGMVEKLLRKDAKVDRQCKLGLTALMLACGSGHTEVVEKLLGKGASADLQDTNGFTALIFASRNGHTVVVRMMLEKGASVDLQDKAGFTALIFASQNGFSEVVEKLLEKSASIDHQQQVGVTALMMASQNGHTEVVEKLLDKGASMHLQARNGRSALMAASLNGHSEMVEKLLDKGASMDLEDTLGWTALMMAREKGHREVIKVLQSKRASMDADVVAAELLREEEAAASEKGKGKGKGKAKKKKQKGGAQFAAAAGEAGAASLSADAAEGQIVSKFSLTAQAAGPKTLDKAAHVKRFTVAALCKATSNYSVRLGSGSAGSVFKGVLTSGTQIAVKKLHDKYLICEAQMYTEVEVLSRVQHTNIVPLLGCSEQGTLSVVYAFMEGGSLEERLACAGGRAPLTARERMMVLADVARGLAFLHTEARVIHRDIKSSNVLIDRGIGRIGDFGIARSVSGDNGMTEMHLHTQAIGTKGVLQ